MKTTIAAMCLMLCASVSQAQVTLTWYNNGTINSATLGFDDQGNPVVGPISVLFKLPSGALWLNETATPPPVDPDDPPANLGDSIARIADGVNDPGPRGAIAALYEIAKVSNETWSGAIEAAKQQRSLVLGLSPKADQWKVAFAAIDALIARVPPAQQNDATLDVIIAALRREQATLLADTEGAGGINWLKIITCLLSGIGGGSVIVGGWYFDRRIKQLGAN